MDIPVLTDKHYRKNVNQAELSLQRERCITCFLPRRLGVKVLEEVVTSELSV